MSNPLVAQPRVDKNGKITTRHVKVDPNAKASNVALPAPSAPAPAKKQKKQVVKPLDRQLLHQTRMLSRSDFKPSSSLCETLGIDDDRWDLASIAASEVQIFDVFSVVTIDDALILLECGFCTADDALEFLEDNGLDDLVIDRRDMMQEAISLRVSSFDLFDLHAKFNIDEYDEKAVLGAARAKGSNMIPSLSDTGDQFRPATFHEGILKEEIDYQDLSEVTFSLLSTHEKMKTEIYDGLVDIKDGNTNLDPLMLKRLIQVSGDDSAHYYSSREMLDEYGPEYIKEIRGLKQATEIWVQNSDEGADYCRKLIAFSEDYAEKGYIWPKSEDAKLYYDAGVSASDARQLASSGMSAQQIVGAHEAGISKAVTGGWL